MEPVINYVGRSFEVLVDNTLFPRAFRVTQQTRYCVIVENDTESYPIAVVALAAALEWKKIRHICACGAKGFAPAMGTTAMGDTFMGCDFCTGNL